MSTKSNSSLLTFKDIDDVFSGFNSEKDRIKYISKHYGDMDIADAFAKFYDLNLSTPEDNEYNAVMSIEVGKCYTGSVTSISKRGITFSVPGVKSEIVSKENFNDCLDAVNNYLLTHDNMLYFEVREKKGDTFYVSVINGYYNMWKNEIEKYSTVNKSINVHIDQLIKGGYLCHTSINTLNELTGKNFTSSVFIPGSNIVLNIESDFEKWVGQDVDIIPQKFVRYRVSGPVEELSLIGSRKKFLQLIGIENTYNIFNDAKLAEKADKYEPAVFDGTVTGIINSNKKCGVFVELDGKYITGLLPLSQSRLLDFRPGDPVKVSVKEFEVQEGKEPFVFNKKGQLLYCNTRMVFELT